MADNCVHYGSENTVNKLRVRIGNPDRDIYNPNHQLISAPNCITCYPTNGLLTKQCKACLVRRKSPIIKNHGTRVKK